MGARGIFAKHDDRPMMTLAVITTILRLHRPMQSCIVVMTLAVIMGRGRSSCLYVNPGYAKLSPLQVFFSLYSSRKMSGTRPLQGDRLARKRKPHLDQSQPLASLRLTGLRSGRN